MRKTSIVILCIALCTTSIVPVFALTFNVDFSGDVTWNGFASGRDSNRYLEVKVYSKNPLPIEIEFSDEWPDILKSYSTDDIELYIRVNKKNDAVKLNFAWGEYKNPSIYRYVCRARGTASILETGDIDITITEVVILERVKPNSFIERYSSTSEEIEFSITFF